MQKIHIPPLAMRFFTMRRRPRPSARGAAANAAAASAGGQPVQKFNYNHASENSMRGTTAAAAHK